MSETQDVYFSVPGVASVSWDGAHKTVFVEWEGWANTAEFKGLLDAEVRAMSEHRASCLLADCRKQRILNPADQERANSEWVPQAIAAGLKRFAIVLPEVEVAAAHLKQRLASVSEMEIGYFATVDDARRWLAR
ncbi:MAG TPA: hypothetical protein VHO95_02410 [Candidatus Dormibacteraeota bacterium]|nr:hypothetical protein [Candidatus Dormibacteraeota bacterium]HEX2680467.1 hypothetical protein [Candidatus Dormibacteraeota bacterium]